ncbi:MAG: NitT/TauT family transport system substrate-binding protein [Gaiellaceae bacterium]|jgi:NitT/TauT family transport system substrate-binding protein|nr:NitT/TauT family transport system substrate-binding protein [Gaiellaceae bacterium]
MKSRRYWVGAIGAFVLAIGIWAVAGAGASPAKHTKAAATKVTLQLKWVTQAQFAGYYAAAAKGYYRQAGLDVRIKVGGPDVTPEQVVAGGQAEFGLDWLPSLLAFRDKGTKLINIAQVFSRSGMTQLTWKSSGITTVAQMRGKKVGNWLLGNEYELFAALTRAGMDPANNKGVTIVKQPFDMNLFMNRQIDSASAMTYNELAQVLETKNPKTGKLTKLSDLNVIKMQNIGTGMLEDGIFTTEKWINDKSHQAIAKKFLAASFKGWIWCRDHANDCVKTVLAQGPTLLGGHQKWQMNEINALVWPNKLGIGIMDKAAYARTARIAKQFGAIKKPAGNGAYRDDLAKAAVSQLKKQGVDVTGKKWKKAVIKLTAGGK